MRRFPALLAAAWAISAAACSRAEQPPARQTAATPDTAPSVPLIAATATLNDVARLVRDPERGGLPADSMVAARVLQGFRIFRETGRYAPAFVGNGMTCGNCHLNAGQRDRGMPLVGIAAVFPEYRARSGRLITLEDRLRDCFERSMNGTAPPYDSPEVLSVAAYITWLSAGQPMGRSPEWRGRNTIPKAAQVPVAQLDTAAGRAIYARQCVACHGADGQGVEVGGAKPGPLWGPRSWNDGAGMGRIYTAAGFIRYAMPLTTPGSLTDREAQEVAAYINAQPRPSFARKAEDYPGASIPPDAVYYLRAARAAGSRR
ncbi:MAG TPA: c-type cytochrome [Longimicrobium sp.]|nr:c-type cytochrome [Longimicrobium sp.]